MLTLNAESTNKPLDQIEVSGVDNGRIQVRDGEGRLYIDAAAQSPFTFSAAGSLGAHVVSQLDDQGATIDTASFKVDCKTEIDDGGKFKKLMELLHDTMFIAWHKGYDKGLRIEGKWYQYYVSWIRDHVHCLKGYKYYDADADGLKSGIELYADSQRDDGMIYDKCKKMLHSELQNWRDVEFAEGDFIKPIPDNPQRRWQRVPVENDVEYLWIEGLYYTWKATGDSDWMSNYLDAALKAVHYSTHDRYRWSEKYKLLKRGYTIDTWDFQHQEDVARSGSSMRVDPDKTIFGVMFGDNTGMAVSCRYLAEMLRVAERDDDAKQMESLANEMTERLNKLAWNGKFFTHHVSEDPSVKRDCGGTDESKQVVQSNAYSLNRRIDHDKCVEIIKSYQDIREVMPKTSAGEFYSCFPIFEKGFRHNDYNYMNGGVTTICGGELAHGAFEHGFESYGVDILERLLDWTEKLGGYLHCCLKGKMPEQLPTTYTALDLSAVANVDFDSEASGDVIAWTDEGENDMRHLPTGKQTFEGIEFDVIDPAANDRRACLGMAQADGYASQVTIPVNNKAQSVYFLHTLSGGAAPVGWYTFHYEDGTHKTQYILNENNISSWFMPAPNSAHVGGNEGKKRPPYLRVAWQGPNGKFDNVGMFVYGWNNPHPDKTITSIDVQCAEHNAKWFIAGISLSDQKVVFPDNPISYGIPDMWGAAAVVYALIEGLAGIVDDGLAFDKVRLSPRWSAAGVDKVSASAVYPNSGGYCAYDYQKISNELQLRVASRASDILCSVLLPENASVTQASLNGTELDIQTETVEGSTYLQVPVVELGAQEIRVTLN